MLKIKFFIILIIMVLSSSLYSSDYNLSFGHNTVQKGLSQSSINCILQDSQGFLWFGTQSGLNKFDGYSYKTYYYSPTDTNSISDNFILSMKEDNQGNLWVGTKRGLNKINLKTNEITRYLSDKFKPSTLFENKVLGILVGNNGYIWVKTPTAIGKFNPKTNKFLNTEHSIDIFCSSNVLDIGVPIIEDNKGRIWIGSNEGLMFFNQETEQFHKYTINNKFGSNDVHAIADDNNGNLWIGTSNGLSKFNKRKGVFISHYNMEDKNSISSNMIYSLLLDKNNDLWIGTNNGLNILKDKVFSVYKHSDDIHSLSHNTVFSLLIDNSRNIWVGTYGGGVNNADLKEKKFNLYNVKSGLTDNDIAAIYKISDDILMIGYWGGGLDIYNRKYKTNTHYSTANSNLKNNFVHKIYKDKYANLWLGTEKGIQIFSTKDFTFKDLNEYLNCKVNISSRVYSIVSGADNDIWVGTKKGLFNINIENGKYTSYFRIHNDTTSLSHNFVYSIILDYHNNIWVGTFNGLNLFDKKNRVFKRMYNEPDVPYSLSSNEIRCIKESTDKKIWLGTSMGLNILNPETMKFKMVNGFNSCDIYAIQDDNDGDFWVSTNKGLIKVLKKDLTTKTYTADDGLQSLEFNLGASLKVGNGELFFGGIQGINSFVPSSIKLNDFVPPIYFTSIVKKNNNESSVLVPDKNNYIHISYKDYMLTVKFAALDYTLSAKNQYRYKMEGISNNWNDLGNSNVAFFSNLAPGEYNLSIQGSNNDGVFNSKSKSLKIIVSPPFWKTYYAYFLYILIIVLLIYMFFKIRTKKLKEDNNRLIEKQNASIELAKQKEALAVKNKSITDSINYAKRIQEAMMPTEYLFQKLLSKSFILYKPKDIVSGDFYWITEKRDKVFIAAVDCTGHGVPGAFMSIIGFDLLRTITKERDIEDPAQILNQLNEGVSGTFSKSDANDTVRDGMDIALCVINKNNNTLEYAGAMNPVYIIRNNKIIVIKGNRFSVGVIDEENKKQFESHIMPLKKGDRIYIFSDGFPDQFGGPFGKKYKYKQFKNLLLKIHKEPINTQKDLLNKEIIDWQGDLEQVDDILVIGMHYV